MASASAASNAGCRQLEHGRHHVRHLPLVRAAMPDDAFFTRVGSYSAMGNPARARTRSATPGACPSLAAASRLFEEKRFDCRGGGMKLLDDLDELGFDLAELSRGSRSCRCR